MNRFLTTVFACALLAGCGVPNGKALADLDEGDWEKLCEEQAEETFTCDLGGGVTYDITLGGTDCEPTDTDGNAYEWPEGCDATVGDMRECDKAYRAALADDPCTTEMPAECDYFDSCMSTEG